MRGSSLADHFPSHDHFPVRATPAQALARAEICYEHEADALREIAHRHHLYNVALGDTADFIIYPGHRCTRDCHLIGPPERERVFVCPMPHTHPQYKRNADGSVLHRWSGCVSVCYKFGVPHVCTSNMCTHQQPTHELVTCTLTGRTLGSEVVDMQELPFSFGDGGKAMTAIHVQSADTDAMSRRMEQYNDTRPETSGRREAVAAAAAHAKQLTADSSSAKKRTIDTSGLVTQVDGSRTAGPTGLIAESAAQRKLLVTDSRDVIPTPLSEPLVVIAQPDATPRPVTTAHPFSVIGDGPTDVDIKFHFRTIVNQLWGQLEDAYDIRKRSEELRVAERRVIVRCIDRRRLSREGSLTAAGSAPMLFGDIAAIHAQETATAMQGMHMVRILASWPQWRSGLLKRKCTEELAERMWKLWEGITRSPKYQNRQEPQLFKRVAGAMLTMVIDGYKIAVCEHTRSGRPFYLQPCAHQKNAVSVAQCGHPSHRLALIAPHVMMQQLLSPEGMKRRAVDPVCGYTHGDCNTVYSFLSSLLERGLTPRQIREIHVK